MMSEEKRRGWKNGVGWFALIVLLLGAFWLRVKDLGIADLTFDEVATVYVASRPFGAVVRYVAGAAREHPPFYYLVMSPWMQAAGTSEFSIRYPSVLIGILTVVCSSRLARRLLNERGGWWGLVLTSVAPLSVWAGRTGRMYALVMLFSVLLVTSWLRWAKEPRRRHWMIFLILSVIAVMTHYYLALILAAEAMLMFVLPRKTKPIRKLWIATLIVSGFVLALFIAVSPGARAMVIEVFGRFPVKDLRLDELHILSVGLYLGGFDPRLAWTAFIAIGMTVAGWVLQWHRDRFSASLLVTWILTPLVILNFVPESLETRYLIPILPALILSLCALLSSTRSWPIQSIALIGVLLFSVWRLPIFYENPNTSFSSRIQTLRIGALPNDALIMNGPWPRLLLRYYHPPEDIEVYGVPEAAPPGFSESVDIPRLEAIAAAHERLWVSYGAIHWTDPKYSVSRWLAENTYCVFGQDGLSLCLPAPEQLIEVARDISLGPNTQLVWGGIDQRSVEIGEALRVKLNLSGRNLNRSIGLRLALLDSSGTPWTEKHVQLGPVHQPSETGLPQQWSELCGLWLLPGIPPAEYTLGLRAEGSNIDVTDAASYYGWIPLTTIQVSPGENADRLLQLLPHNEALSQSPDAEDLTLVGFEPYSKHYMQGHPIDFRLWWQVHQPGASNYLQVRLSGPEEWAIGDFAIGPDFYPPEHWQSGDVVRQSIFAQLPKDISPGNYLVQIRLTSPIDMDNPETARPQITDEPWFEVFDVAIEARERRSRPPLLIRRVKAKFGDVFQLEGYRLEPSRLQRGTEAKLTIYWRALQAPQRIYAAFNHLRLDDGTVVWQEDSWPQSGVHTTDHWLEGEVVGETYTLSLSDDLAPGVYTLYTGLYDPVTGERLVCTDSKNQPLPGNEIALIEFTVD
jgi:4-amino-4-deoxy-L-arabinose transferase-like glycosyltransferase